MKRSRLGLLAVLIIAPILLIYGYTQLSPPTSSPTPSPTPNWSTMENILVGTPAPTRKIIQTTFVGDGDYNNLMNSIKKDGKQPFKYMDYLYVAFADLNSSNKIYYPSDYEPRVKAIIEEARKENLDLKIFAQFNWASHLKPLQNKALIDEFAKSIPPFLKQYNFSGIDFDWEQPALDITLASYLFTQVKSNIGSGAYLSISVDTQNSLDAGVINQYVDIVVVQSYQRLGYIDYFINIFGINKSKIYVGICTENDDPNGFYPPNGDISAYTKKVTDLGLPGLYAWRIDNDDTDHTSNLPRYTITKAMWNFSRGEVPPL